MRWFSEILHVQAFISDNAAIIRREQRNQSGCETHKLTYPTDIRAAHTCSLCCVRENAVVYAILHCSPFSKFYYCTVYVLNFPLFFRLLVFSETDLHLFSRLLSASVGRAKKASIRVLLADDSRGRTPFVLGKSQRPLYALYTLGWFGRPIFQTMYYLSGPSEFRNEARKQQRFLLFLFRHPRPMPMPFFFPLPPLVATLQNGASLIMR